MRFKNTFSAFLLLLGTITSYSQEPLWLKAIQGTNDEEGFDVCVDNDGAIITCGYFYSNTLYAGNMSLEKQSSCDAYVIKYNSNGDPIWLDNPGGATLQEAHGIRSDQDNNIYVTGLFRGNFQFAGTILQSGNEANAFLIKYDADGDEIWAVEMNSYDVAEGREISIDEDGNIIIGIRFRGSLTIGDTTLSNHGSMDLAIIKFNPQGEVIWTRSYGGGSLDFIMNLCTDDLNHVYFTGGAHSGSITFGNYTLINQSTQRLAFIAHLDESGEVIWAEGHDDGYDQEYFGIAVDSEHNIYTCGYYKEVFNFGPYSIYGDGGHFDVFVAKYNSSHEHQWINKIATTIYGRSDHLILDYDENPVMNIQHFGNLIIDGQTIINQGGEDLTLAKFNATSGLMWTLHAGGMLDDRSFGLASGPLGNLYFTGYFNSPTLEIGPFSIDIMGRSDAYIAALGPPCPLPDPAFTFSTNELNVQFTATGDADTYSWDFGDGGTSTEKEPVHTYDSIGSYQVCLTVQNICGQNIDCKEVNICVDPTAGFSWASSELMVGFYQNSTFADQYQWDFGDGTHSYELNPIHEYEDYGNYIVSLIVFNDCGADQHFDTVYLLQPMMCNFGFTVDEYGTVHFSNESIEASSYYWNFGDGTSSTEVNPVHQYKENGTYECCLAIETEYGVYNHCTEVKVETPQEEETALNIYVNTPGQTLVIDIPADGTYRIFIYDTWGKPAYSDEAQLPKNSVYEVGLKELPHGIYIVSIESEGLFERIKVLVP